MTTSHATSALNFNVLRLLVDSANALPLADRITLLKGLIPGTAQDLTHAEFHAMMRDLVLKGDRWYEAVSHPGEGRATRSVMGERDREHR